jgi:VWFA-related protein
MSIDSLLEAQLVLKRRPPVSTFLISVAMAQSGFSQQPSSPLQLTPPGQTAATPAPYNLEVNAQVVVLDVVVTNSRGEIVTNLKQDDFEVYDDRILQNVRTLEPPSAHRMPHNQTIHSTAELDRVAPNTPVTLIVLDEINTGFQDEAFARYSLKKFLDTQGDTLQQPTLLGTVDMHHFTLLHDYTTSKQEILDALEHHLAAYPWQKEGTSWHAQQFNASFAALLEIAKATTGHPGHKSLVWVGQGFPPFDPTTLTPEQNQGLKQVIEACTNELRDARVALYTLDPAGVSMEPPTENLDGFIDDPFSGMLDFNIMAKATGGHAFYGRNDIDKLIATSSRDGTNFFTLSYRPQIPVTDARAFHSIRVVMKNPDLVAETREGYYARRPPAPATPVINKQANRQAFDLALAAQSMLVYDAVRMTIQRVIDQPDEFKVTLNSGDLAWEESGGQKLIGKITVVAETFDRRGASLNRNVKISTLQVGEGSPHIPDSVTVILYTSIPTKAPAERVRFVVRVDASQKIGAVNFLLSDKKAAGNDTK